MSLPQKLAQLCHQYQIELFFISTDYVFDGLTPPYAENAYTHPLNDYGFSKQQAEQAVLNYPAHTVIRVPVLYGEVEFIEESALTITWAQLQQNTQPVMDNWAIRYPTHVNDIAATIYDVLDITPPTMVNGVEQEPLDGVSML